MTGIGKYIDNTLLKPDATEDGIRKLCAESIEYGCASVCVNPCFVKLASECLRGTGVCVCTVVGFPLGANATEIKAMEAAWAAAQGAQELDMVINVGKLKAGDDEYVLNDIKAVVRASGGRLVKVIIEACLLTDDEKIRACALAKRAGAQFVKTSTGFAASGATQADVKLMRETVGADMGVKAAGGVRDYDSALNMLNAGATRIGASSGKTIVEGERARTGRN